MDSSDVDSILKVLDRACAHFLVRIGSFCRKSDGKKVQRFRCKFCKLGTSCARLEREYRQHKRHLNDRIFLEIGSGISQNRCAVICRINRKTVARKIRFFGPIVDFTLAKQNQNKPPVKAMQFDELETFELTKCMPVSLLLAVEEGSRRGLGLEVCPMPAKGLLSKRALKKYGPRKDMRPQARERLFPRLKPLLAPGAVIKSDDSPHYPASVKKHFPDCVHWTTKGGRGSSTGQGELKRKRWDPIYSINHTFAKLRDDLKRLARRNWCTTKDLSQLRTQVTMMLVLHNHRLWDPKLKFPIYL